MVITGGAEDGRVSGVSLVSRGRSGNAGSAVEYALTVTGQLADLVVGDSVSSADDAWAFSNALPATGEARLGGLGSDSGSEDGEDSKLEH